MTKARLMTKEEALVIRCAKRLRAAKTILTKMKWTIELRHAVDALNASEGSKRAKR
jgi:hypothetical protein